MRTKILPFSFLIFAAMSAACTTVAAPGLRMLQDGLSAYHIEIHAGAPGAAVVSSRAIALTGEAEAGFKVTAPMLDGERRTVVARTVSAGEFGAWTIRLFKDDGTWIEIERVSCAAAREHLPEISCPEERSTTKLWQMREPDIVRRRIRL